MITMMREKKREKQRKSGILWTSIPQRLSWNNSEKPSHEHWVPAFEKSMERNFRV
jgi:hypothetical protein